MDESHNRHLCGETKSRHRRATRWDKILWPVLAISFPPGRICVCCLRCHKRLVYHRATNTVMSHEHQPQFPVYPLTPILRSKALHEFVAEVQRLKLSWTYHKTSTYPTAKQRLDIPSTNPHLEE